LAVGAAMATDAEPVEEAAGPRTTGLDLLDDDPFEGIVFSETLEQAISDVMPSDDELDRADFNATAYINKLFPTEESLLSVDPFLEGLRSKIATLDTEVMDTVRLQTTGSQAAQAELEGGKAAVQELFLRVQQIKAKAAESEAMVRGLPQGQATRTPLKLKLVRPDFRAFAAAGRHARAPAPRPADDGMRAMADAGDLDDAEADQLWSLVRQILEQTDALGSHDLSDVASDLERLLAVHDQLLAPEGALDAATAMHARERDVYADKMQRAARRLAAEGGAAAENRVHDVLSKIVLATRDQLEAARAAAAEGADHLEEAHG